MVATWYCGHFAHGTRWEILNRPVQRLYPMELHVPDEPVAARDTSSPSESVTAMTPATAAEVESTNVSRFESTVLSNADPTWDCVGNNGQTRRGRQIRLPAKFQTVLNLYGNVVVVDV